MFGLILISSIILVLILLRILEQRKKPKLDPETNTSEERGGISLSSGKNSEENSFVAIDFEIANRDQMACQLGIVVVEDGNIIEEKSYLIQPPNNKYDISTVRIHGITPEMTENSETFDILWDKISKYFQSGDIVAHNFSFDRDVLIKNLSYYGISLNEDNLTWICTYRLYNYGLEDLCKAFRMSYEKHHDGLFDAKCCAQFYLNHLNGIIPDYSLIPKRENSSRKSFNYDDHTKITGDLLKVDLSGADPSNPFYNKKVVITGIFNNFDRLDLAQRLKNMGSDNDTTVTEKTSFVVAGKNPGPAKLKKAKELQERGKDIKIISEEELIDIFGKFNN